MLLNRSTMILVMCALASCSPQLRRDSTSESAGDSEVRRTFFMERIVSIDGNRYFSTPLNVKYVNDNSQVAAIPVNVRAALDELARMLPEDATETTATAQQIDACRLDTNSPGQLNGFTFRCGASLCSRLNKQDRDSPCSFFIRFADWIESEWLGGNCSTSRNLVNNALVRSFRSAGVDKCETMSAILINGILLRLINSDITLPDLIRLNLERDKP